MDLPPNIGRTFLQLTTSGTANTVTSATLVAAPGAGFRYRIFGFCATPANTVQAAANWRAQATSGIGGNPLLECSGSNFASPGVQFVEGGFTMPSNTAIGYSLSSALINMVLNLELWATTEAG